MEEKILSGYCRALDQSRMVTVELEDGNCYPDCSYGSCPYEKNCTIAQSIQELE